MSFGVWRSCNKAEIQMRLGLTFSSRAHGKHGKQGFNFSKHMPQHMAHGKHGPGQTRIQLLQTQPQHMAHGSRAHGKKGFNFYNHAPQHMANRAHGTAHSKHVFNFYKHKPRHLANMANTYPTFTSLVLPDKHIF